jgi:hypothetical protein
VEEKMKDVTATWSLNTRLLSFAGALIIFAYSAPNVRAEGLSNETSEEGPTIEQLLSRVSGDATWQDLTPNLRADFEKHASLIFAQDRQLWGLSGLQQKEYLLLSAPTPAMTENVDRILSISMLLNYPAGSRWRATLKTLSSSAY